MAKITINDVAKHAGVSITTVSRVLNNRGYISDATREKVQSSINELGFIPNELARSFFTCSSNLIGLIIPTTANPFFGELTFYIEKQLSKEGYKLFICNSINENENEKEYLRMLQENRVDGIIVGSHNLNIEEYDKLPLKAVSVERVLLNMVFHIILKASPSPYPMRKRLRVLQKLWIPVPAAPASTSWDGWITIRINPSMKAPERCFSSTILILMVFLQVMTYWLRLFTTMLYNTR